MLLRIFTLCSLAALAVGTWVLSTQSRAPNSRSHAAAEKLPGYYLKGTVMTDYDTLGAASIKIAAERIQQVAQSTEVELFNVRLDYQTPTGQTWIMVGDKAHVQAGGKRVDVSGNVQLQGLDQGREGPATVHTNALSYDVDTAEVRTDSDVKIMFGPHTLMARGLLARLKDRTMRLESRVNGRFTP
jgi:LPS export ABC transporter protein LptC